MCELDLEDINFLNILADELRKIDGDTYQAEAEELENIIFRAKDSTFQKVNFKCSVCGSDSWMEVDLSTYVVSITDLVCDDCNPVEED